MLAMRVLIVDDERPARDKLRRLLAQEAGVSAIEEARDGVEALERAASFAPDLVLLDIQMPEVSGLDVAASLPAPAPLVVFVTAYDQYAIQAFDANAIDYLLKPYDQPRLQRALARARERLALPAQAPAQLLVMDRGTTQVVKVSQLQWIETADNYVILHTAESQPLMRQTLAGLLDKLGPAFLRCHRRAAVQLDWIASVVSLDKGDAELVLRGGARVPCSRQYRAALVAQLATIRAPERPPSC
jgi:two-component system LytT family response regulator